MLKTLKSRLGTLEWIALIILGAILICAIFPSLIAGYDPLKTGAGRPLLAPNSSHPFGTDELGRDVFSRVVWGARISVAISVSATLMALIAGSLIGSIIAVRRDTIGSGIAMLINLILVFPGVILAIALATVLVPSATTTAIVLAILYTPPISRLVAATIQAEYGKPYVASLQVIGASDVFILMRAVAKTVATVVLTFTLVILADAVLLEAALSFIGVGVQAPTPSWGNIVSGGRTLMSSGRWWVATGGGLAIVLFALSVNILGDALSTRQKRLPHAKSKAKPVVADDDVGGEASLLKVRDLSIKIPAHYGDRDVVHNVSLDVDPQEVLSVVGESGAGKSLIAKAILGFLPRGAVVTGSVQFEGEELLGLKDRQLQNIRGNNLAYLPQDSIASLNPVLKVGRQMEMICDANEDLSPTTLLEQVRLPAERVLDAYPHELSGGQCQRIALAMALAKRPKLLVADEPTTALDVSVQAEIFKLIEELRSQLGFSMLLITHDLALVSSTTNKVAVAYQGRIIEKGSTKDVFERPQHAYTQGLLRSVQSLENREPELYWVKNNELEEVYQ